ncbi:MAG: hypothetical protein M8357_16920, partial [Desulfobulbaceae bacterium]|nr:hypothetical protein [Desulfobulbaceae bacterium]
QPEYLPELIEIYCLGQRQPDAFFVEPALAYVRQAHKLNTGSRSAKSALDIAMEQLARAVEQPYEPELRRLYRNAEDIAQALGESFERQCQALLQDVWAATHGN